MTAFVNHYQVCPIVPVIIQDCDCRATKEIRRSDQLYSYSTKMAANTAPRTAATVPMVRPAAAPGKGTVEPLDEPGFVPLGAEPEGAGAVPAADVVGNGGVTEARVELAVAALVSCGVELGVELATGELDATASEVDVASAGVVDAGATTAVAAHPHTAAADD